MGRKRNFTLLELIIVVAIFGVLGSVIYGNTGGRIWNRGSETFTAKVVRKYEYTRNNNSVFRIDVQRTGSETIETIENYDEWYQGKWNSATIQANLIEGQSYQLSTVGIRNEYFSYFPNLIDTQPASVSEE